MLIRTSYMQRQRLLPVEGIVLPVYASERYSAMSCYCYCFETPLPNYALRGKPSDGKRKDFAKLMTGRVTL